jgi:hypothetical protein
LSPNVCNLYSEYLIRDAVEGLGGFNIGGQVIISVLLTRVQTVLQGMIGRITEIGKCYVREINLLKPIGFSTYNRV